jgi:P-type Na+/K+ transporter
MLQRASIIVAFTEAHTDIELDSVRKDLKGQWKATGDHTEVALQVFTLMLGLGRSKLTKEALESEAAALQPAMGEAVPSPDGNEKEVRFEKTDKDTSKRYEPKIESPFSSDLKRMTTIYLDKEAANPKENALVLIKGAVSCLSSISTPLVLTIIHLG